MSAGMRVDTAGSPILIRVYEPSHRTIRGINDSHLRLRLALDAGTGVSLRGA